MSTRRFACLSSVVWSLMVAPLLAERASMNVVGDYMARMLQNSHFARPQFSGLSQRFLDDFLAQLDGERLFFVQSDIDRFQAEYGARMSELLMRDKGADVAVEIYQVFRRRVAERVAQTKKLLAADDFDFTTNEAIEAERKDAPWPADDAAAAALWALRVKDSVLTEMLHRDALVKKAAEKGKSPETVVTASVAQKIALRHDRMLHRVMEEVDDREIAAMLFSAVALAFDPHSDYLAAAEMGRFKEDMRNELVGIGAELKAEEDGGTRISRILPGGPADKSGKLKARDVILGVDPDGIAGPKPLVDTMYLDQDRVVELIRGELSTTVALKISRGAAGDEVKVVEIERGTVELKDALASARILHTKGADGVVEKLGVITLPSFYVDFDEKKPGCSDDVETLLIRLKREGIEGLILDLRQNGGGSLMEVQRMAGFFVGGGPVTQVKDARGRIDQLNSDVSEAIYKGPMIVLTDKSSASASEILAGALQDSNRALIVGQSSTFGKGTVQRTLDIAPNMPVFAARDMAGTLKLTIQKFYRPSGSSTQNLGVVPDIVLPHSGDAYEFGEAFLKHPLKHDFIAAARGFRPFDREALFVPQLRQRSEERVAASPDFAYVQEDIAYSRKQLSENRVSLNRRVREKEDAELERIRKAREKEREVRFAEMEKRAWVVEAEDLTVEQAAVDEPLVRADPSKDVADDDDSALRWPDGLDLHKREGVMILQDMVALGRQARVGGVAREMRR